MTATHVICVYVPIKTVSPNVSNNHWAARSQRAKRHREAVGWVLSAHRPELPCTVTLTRIAPGQGLDQHDNLRGAFKHVVDGVAAWLGVPDKDKRIDWRYDQRRGKPREYAVEISISTQLAEPAETVTY